MESCAKPPILLHVEAGKHRLRFALVPGGGFSTLEKAYTSRGRIVGELHMSDGLKFACPSCGNEYSWNSRLAGRKGKCKCGEIMRIPAEPPGSSRATKSAAVMSRPMPRPMPTPTSLYEDSSAHGVPAEGSPSGSQSGSPSGSTGAGAISPAGVQSSGLKEEVAPPEPVAAGAKKSSMFGALRGLWPRSQKR